MKAQARVIACRCVSPQQDSMHGAGMRVHNPCVPANDKAPVPYRCTVCRNETTP